MENISNHKVDISIILPCHEEGILIHRTIRSIKKSIKHTGNKFPDLKFEIIIALDNPSIELKEYFNEYNDKLFRFFESDFSDAGKNRNFAISQAEGEFIALVDADDLISDNWFTEAYIQAKDPVNEKVLFHPRWTIYFERENLIARHIGSDEKDFHYSNLIESNYWSALFFCKKSVFDDLKYEDTSNGYAYEDWHLFCEALAKGYTIHVIEETAYYIRRKKQGSRLSQHNQNYNTLRPSKLFNKEVYNNLIKEELKSSSKLINYERHENLRTSLRTIKNKINSITKGKINFLLERVSRYLKKDIGIIDSHLINLSIPTYSWLVEDWKNKNLIEPMLFPEKFFLYRFLYYQVANNFTGLIYSSLLEKMPEEIDYMFIIPWLKQGGAEKVILNYITFLLSINSKYKIVVIATELSGSPWAYKLPKSVFYFELANNSKNLEPSQRLDILLKLVVQYPPKAIHVVNSELGHQLVQKYGPLIKKKSKLYCSIFCEGYSDEGRLIGLMFDYLPPSYWIFNGISTDNKRIIKKLKDIYAFNTNNFYTHYQPIKIGNRKAIFSKLKKDKEMNIIWAGRIDDQKWPELLFEICDKCSDIHVKFHVWGSTVLSETEFYLKEIAKRNNIYYHGPFNDFLELPLNQYDLLLYTSKYDGVPNVLLEAMSVGLPVISTSNGAVTEVIIDKKTGYIINSSDEFLSVLKMIFDNTNLLEEISIKQKKFIAQQHSRDAFIKELKRFPGYIVN